MRLEFHPIFADPPQVAEAKYLKAAAIGEDGAVPMHELV